MEDEIAEAEEAARALPEQIEIVRRQVRAARAILNSDEEIKPNDPPAL